MKNDKHFTSRMFICSGILMTISGLLFMICVKPAYGGIFFAAASCMFFAARSFRIKENEDDSEEKKDE